MISAFCRDCSRECFFNDEKMAGKLCPFCKGGLELVAISSPKPMPAAPTKPDWAQYEARTEQALNAAWAEYDALGQRKAQATTDEERDELHAARDIVHKHIGVMMSALSVFGCIDDYLAEWGA